MKIHRIAVAVCAAYAAGARNWVSLGWFVLGAAGWLVLARRARNRLTAGE